MVTERNPERDAAFALAKLLPDTRLRTLFTAIGADATKGVVVALDATPAIQVFEKVFTRSGNTAVIAIQRTGAEPFGFVFMHVVPATHPLPEPTPEKADLLNAATSIGMLYDVALGQEHASYDIGDRFAYELQAARPDLAGV
jgi:hypothetical protein